MGNMTRLVETTRWVRDECAQQPKKTEDVPQKFFVDKKLSTFKANFKKIKQQNGTRERGEYMVNFIHMVGQQYHKKLCFEILIH